MRASWRQADGMMRELKKENVFKLIFTYNLYI